MSDSQYRLVSLSARLAPVSDGIALPAEIGLHVLLDASIGRAWQADCAAAAEAAREPLATKEKELRGTDAALRLHRLTAGLATAQRELDQAKQIERHALKLARLAVGDGDDPTAPEVEAMEARQLQTVMANRIAGLETALVQARQVVEDERRRALSGHRDDLRRSALAEYQRTEASVLLVLSQYVQHLLVADAAVRSLAPGPDDVQDEVADRLHATTAAQIEANSRSTFTAAPPVVVGRATKCEADADDRRAASLIAAFGGEVF